MNDKCKDMVAIMKEYPCGLSMQEIRAEMRGRYEYSGGVAAEIADLSSQGVVEAFVGDTEERSGRLYRLAEKWLAENRRRPVETAEDSFFD